MSPSTPPPDSDNLSAEWSRHGSAHLDSYLVQEVENPCFNPQSVLLRAFLADLVAPGQNRALIERELYYSAAATFAVLGQREGWFADLCRRVWRDGEIASLPEFMQSHESRSSGAFSLRQLFNDLCRCFLIGFDELASPFENLWKDALEKSQTVDRRIDLLEVACGSANDFRYWHSYGIASRLNYTGVDVCPENIANATARFPKERFLIGDARALQFDDAAFDITCAFDLLEHLSPEGIAQALSEIVRVTRDELWISFNLADIPAHDIRKDGDSGYHCNLLSIAELRGQLETLGCTVEVISVANEFTSRFPEYRHYNDEAHILIARRDR